MRLVEDVEMLEGEAVVTPAVPSLHAVRWENSTWQIGHGYRLTLETLDCGWLPLDELKPLPGRRKFYESPALNGCALAISRDLYNRLHGFDADMLVWGVEDLDFGLRSWMMGHSILHDPEAVVGHRFRATFDTYEVPYECLLVNQLRMARKCFTTSVWNDWVERCQRRHANRRSEHPEGLWARAWHLFHEHLASADVQRANIQGSRVRDEFGYGERFALTWPRVRSLQLAPGVVSLEGAAGAASSPSPEPYDRRTILIFGYWPPTDIGISGNRSFPKPPFASATYPGHGMFWDWQKYNVPKERYRGHKLVIVTPTFQYPIGYNNFAPGLLAPFWGDGEGSLTVDYNRTAKFFWKTVLEHSPVAILSFSRGELNKRLELGKLRN